MSRICSSTAGSLFRNPKIVRGRISAIVAIPKPIRSVPALPSAAACVLAERYWLSVADEPGISLRADQISLLRDWDIEMWSNTIPVMLLWLEATLASGLRTALLSNMPDDMVAHVRLQFS